MIKLSGCKRRQPLNLDATQQSLMVKRRGIGRLRLVRARTSSTGLSPAHTLSATIRSPRVRMDAVRLIQLASPGDAVEQKRQQRHALLLRDRRIHAREIPPRTSARGSAALPSGRAAMRASGRFALIAIERRLEVRAQRRRRNAAQPVVRAGLEHHHVERCRAAASRAIEQARTTSRRSRRRSRPRTASPPSRSCAGSASDRRCRARGRGRR